MSRTDKADRTGGSRGVSRAGLCWAALWLAFAAACFAHAAPEGFWSGRIGRGPAEAGQATLTSAPPPARSAHRTAPIEHVRVGQKVLGRNPELTDAERTAAEQVDPATWRKVALELPKPAGGWVDIELLRGPVWLAATGAAPGGTVYLSMPELGVEGRARVLSIGPCPEIPPGPGQVVTGTFTHTAGNVVDLYLAGQESPLGVMANHPIWSEDRARFVPAGDLRPGETLRSLSGPLTVAGLLPRPAPQPVFNLEIAGEHAYQVSRDGVVVHNSYAGSGNYRRHMAAVQDFVAHARKNGFSLLGTEVSVTTPFGTRKFDVVLRNVTTKEVTAVEIKSSMAAFNRWDAAARQQFAADRYVKQFSAEAIGKGKRIGVIQDIIKVVWKAK